MTYYDLESSYLNKLPQNKNACILDFGCGNGRVLHYLQQLGYKNLHGVDVDPKCVEHVKKNYQIDAACATDTIDFLTNKKSTYDLIIAKDVIYYFSKTDLTRLSKSLNHALKPGGQIIIEIFNGAAFTGPYVMHKDIGILTILTEQSLSAFLENGHFKNIKVFPNRIRKNSIKHLIFRTLQKLWQVILRFIYISERGIDSQNPKLLDKQIIAIADKASP